MQQTTNLVIIYTRADVIKLVQLTTRNPQLQPKALRSMFSADVCAAPADICFVLVNRLKTCLPPIDIWVTLC